MNWHELSVTERDEIVHRFFAEGEQAFLSGGSIDECPYRYDKQEAIWWRRGFGNARLGAQLDRKH